VSWILNNVLNVYYLNFNVIFHFQSGGPVIGITKCWGWYRYFRV